MRHNRSLVLVALVAAALLLGVSSLVAPVQAAVVDHIGVNNVLTVNQAQVLPGTGPGIWPSWGLNPDVTGLSRTAIAIDSAKKFGGRIGFNNANSGNRDDTLSPFGSPKPKGISNRDYTLGLDPNNGLDVVSGVKTSSAYFTGKLVTSGGSRKAIDIHQKSATNASVLTSSDLPSRAGPAMIAVLQVKLASTNLDIGPVHPPGDSPIHIGI